MNFYHFFFARVVIRWDAGAVLMAALASVSRTLLAGWAFAFGSAISSSTSMVSSSSPSSSSALSVSSLRAARFTVQVRDAVVAFTLILALPVLALTVLFAVLAAAFAGFFGGIAREGSLYGRVCEF
ncbi:hypothetical protein PILCRDRAFT_645025 [Piloderma croceum F 1598]|uniref:Uncharacterized protein n=1 Tax=Piloderma croceum (strain F 1598) TaxID=765440 RepID=A0A0C3F981_PILCF|nr:hypothetical protein PILCRDRAFT_645025 [Piloderma croceum F 1598]